MEPYNVKILSIEKLTHDVLQIQTKKPAGYAFTPGQATEVAINKEKWISEKRPFTITNLPDDDYLEFIIKTYPHHSGVTNELLSLKKGVELIIHDPWGAIHFKGKGVFIAGGAGITPFISIFRDLVSKKQIGENQLIYGNKTKKDIIHESWLKKLFGPAMINVLSEEIRTGYHHGFISTGFLQRSLLSYHHTYYVCGPPPMTASVLQSLHTLGISENVVVTEV